MKKVELIQVIHQADKGVSNICSALCSGDLRNIDTINMVLKSGYYAKYSNLMKKLLKKMDGI